LGSYSALGYYNPKIKTVSLLSPLTIPNRLPSSSSRISLSCSLLSHSPVELFENINIIKPSKLIRTLYTNNNPQSYEKCQKSNKITTTQINSNQISKTLLPSASLSLSLSLSLSRIIVRLLPPPRDNPGPLWAQSLKRAFAGSLPPAALRFLSNLSVTANQLSRPSQASSRRAPSSASLFNLSTLPELWIDLGGGLCVGGERLGGEERG